MSLSDFVILSKIGEGAYSSVHKVKRISDSSIYALKKVFLFKNQVKISNLK
jgi:NIMA (never in mitosis gene a)-related kinase